MTKHKLLVIGGTSFLGLHLLKWLSKHHKSTVESVGTYLTKKPKTTPIPFHRCNALSKADVFSLGTFDTIVLYASKIMGGNKKEMNKTMVKNIVELANETGAKLIFISSSQVNFDTQSEYRLSKVEDEKFIKDNAKQYVIIRPAAPYGPIHSVKLSRKQPFHVLSNWIKRFPLVPVIGNGKYLRQPVHVDNLNELVLKSALDKNTKSNIFEIGGPKQLSFNKIVTDLAKHHKKRVIKCHLPITLFLLAAKFVSFIDKENLKSVSCDEKVNNNSWKNHINIKLIPFEEGVSDL